MIVYLTLMLFLSVETIEIIRPLKDQKITDLPATATFECEISKRDAEGTWYKGSEKIKKSKKYSFEVEGGVQRLIIKDVCDEDDDEYTFAIKDLKTKAALFIEVKPKLLLDQKFKDSITLRAGKSHVIEVPYTGSPQAKATWLLDGEELPPAKKSRVDVITNMTALTLHKVTRKDAGDYMLVLKNPNGKCTLTVHVNVIGNSPVLLYYKPANVIVPFNSIDDHSMFL